MRVPETVPANDWQLKLAASRLQTRRRRFFGFSGVPLRQVKIEFPHRCQSSFTVLCHERLAYGLAHWHIPATAFVLGVPNRPS